MTQAPSVSVPRWQQQRRHQQLFVEAVLWALAGMAPLVGAGGGLSNAGQTRAVSVVGLAFGLFVFARHGGRRITAAGTFSFAFAVFGCLASYYNAGGAHFDPHESLRVILIAYYGQVAMCYLFWTGGFRSAGTDRPVERAAFAAAPEVTRWGIVTGSVLTAAGCSISYLGLGDPAGFVVAASYTGTTLLAASLLLHQGGGRGTGRAVAVGVVLILDVALVFTGFGRLNLAGLGFAIVMAAQLRWPGWWVKAAVPVLTIPATVYLAHSRVAYTAMLNPHQSSRVTGFESVVSPASDLQRLLALADAGKLPHGDGSTLVASVVALCPRSLWPGKPIGFGALLSDLLAPQLRGTGNSLVALLYGEMVFNFGAAGIVITVLFAGWTMRFIDSRRAALRLAIPPDRSSLLRVVGYLLAISGTLDLYWGGTFTVMTRTGERLIVLLALWALPQVLSFHRRSAGAASRPSSRVRLTSRPRLRS